MKNLTEFVIVLCALNLFTGCEIISNSAKYNFANGYYFSRLNTGKVKKYYVVTGERFNKSLSFTYCKANGRYGKIHHCIISSK